MDVIELRKQFPQLEEKVYGKSLVYLDNAATSLRPSSVINHWTRSASFKTANLHRAVHHIAAEATEDYENARSFVASCLNAESPDEIVFTSGATAALNLVAFCFGEAFISEGDEIIIAQSEHHSDIVPWQMLCRRKASKIKVWEVDENGHLSLEQLENLITERTKIVCVAHISNVLGLVNLIKEIANICHSRNCVLLCDGAQGMVHQRVDVRELGCDFYLFSGHKLYAAPGTGVLYGRRELLEQMPPYMGGGEMIETVKWSGSTYAPLPRKYEAGTQNISGTPTLSDALALAREMDTPEINANLLEIRDFVLNKLLSDPRIRLYGLPGDGVEKIPLFSFSVEHCHHEDLALILDKMGVAVRSGQMCAEPLMDRFGVTGMLRASFAPYNTMEEAEYFIESLNKAINMLV